MELARLVASWSKDPSTQCGAVIVRPDKTIASLGFNGLPAGHSDDPIYLEDREQKYSRVVHSEMNALLFLRERAVGYTMYVHPMCPCDRCMAHICQAGIAKVVHPTGTHERWEDAMMRAYHIAKECGVEMVSIS